MPVAGMLLFILAATLGRTELPPPGVRNVDWCFACGSQWGIDFVLNIVFFVPLGLALYLSGVGRRRSAIAVVALTLAIELVQLAIPSRITSTGDLLANSIGGLAGFELGGRLRAIILPTARQAAGWLVAAGLAVPAVLALTLWLFHPAPTDYPYWGQFAPTLGQFAKFHGRIIEAHVGSEPLRDGRLPNTDAVRSGLASSGTVVEAIVEPGPPTAGLAPAVSIFDGRHNEVMLLGRDGENLVFRLRTRAMRLGLRTPSVTVWNAYRVSRSDPERAPVRIAGRVDGYSITGEARADTTCASRTIDFRPTHGWAYVLPFENLYTSRAARFTAVWVAVLFLPLGYYAGIAAARAHGMVRRAGVAAWTAAAATGGLVGIPLAAGLSSGTRMEWQGAALGVAAGAAVGIALLALAARTAAGGSGSGSPHAGPRP